MRRIARAPSFGLELLALAAVLACACEAVPTLTFEERDAAPDVEDAAGSPDASDDASDGGCTGASVPQAAFVCCGAVMCQGPCTGQCDACTSKCTAGQVCCAKSNNVVCFAAGTVCK